MKGPNWNKSPEGARFWVTPGFRIWEAAWYKREGDRWYYHHPTLGWLREHHLPGSVIFRMVEKP